MTTLFNDSIFYKSKIQSDVLLSDKQVFVLTCYSSQLLLHVVVSESRRIQVTLVYNHFSETFCHSFTQGTSLCYNKPCFPIIRHSKSNHYDRLCNSIIPLKYRFRLPGGHSCLCRGYLQESTTFSSNVSWTVIHRPTKGTSHTDITPMLQQEIVTDHLCVCVSTDPTITGPSWILQIGYL